MRFRLFDLTKKSLILLPVVIFIATFLQTFIAISKVSASKVSPTTQVEYQKSSSSQNLLNIKSAEENKALNVNCGYATVTGTLAEAVFQFPQEILSYRYDETLAPAYFCDDTSLITDGSGGGILKLIENTNVAILNERPLSGIDYIEEKVYAITNPGLVYAQSADPLNYYPGTGYSLLEPIRSFWGWSVNFVFGFLIIIILIIAFAIIFRQRLPGNVEVTIQTAIPNIALAMILIPLSYSISGLFIDAITIGSNAVHGFLLGPQSPGFPVYRDRNASGTPIDDRGLYIDDERVNWLNARSQVDLRQEVEGITADGLGVNNNAIFSVIAGFLNILDEDAINDTAVTPGAASAWIGTILNAVISILMVWIGVKTFIKLFQKYLSLILMPIFSPFIFATIAIPGNGTKAIVTYAKQMGANSIAFIVTYMMFLLTIIFSNSSFQATIPDFRTGIFVPPLLSLNTLFLFGDRGQGAGIVPFILGLISLGIYFSIPSVLDQIDDALGAKFTLPQFIKTPIDSFRESWRVTTRTAPALVGQGAVAAGRLTKNAGFLPGRSYTALRGGIDRLRGISPTDARFYTNRVRTNLAEELEAAEDARDRAIAQGGVAGGLARAAAEARIAAIKGAGDFSGAGIGSPLPPDQQPKLEVTGNEVVISQAQLANLVRSSGAFNYNPATGTLARVGAIALQDVFVRGLLRVKATGKDAKITNPVVLTIGNTAENPTTKVHEYEGIRTVAGRRMDDIFAVSQTGTLIQRRSFEGTNPDALNPAGQYNGLQYSDPTNPAEWSNVNATNLLAPRDTMRVVIPDGPVLKDATEAGTYNIPFLVSLRDMHALFGTSFDTASFKPLNAGIMLQPGGGGVRSQRMSFKIEDMYSPAFRITIKLQ